MTTIEAPPVASPPASVEEIARELINKALGTHQMRRAWLARLTVAVAALLSDRAAMAERVAGLERERDAADQAAHLGNMNAARAITRAEAFEAEVARLREAAKPFAAPTFFVGTGNATFLLRGENGEPLLKIMESDIRELRAALIRPDEPTKET